jgi:hypothetical protein
MVAANVGNKDLRDAQRTRTRKATGSKAPAAGRTGQAVKLGVTKTTVEVDSKLWSNVKVFGIENFGKDAAQVEIVRALLTLLIDGEITDDEGAPLALTDQVIHQVNRERAERL